MRLKIIIKGNMVPYEHFEVIDMDTGLEIKEIKKLSIDFSMDDLPQVKFEIVTTEVDFEFEGEAEVKGLDEFMRTKAKSFKDDNGIEYGVVDVTTLADKGPHRKFARFKREPLKDYVE